MIVLFRSVFYVFDIISVDVSVFVSCQVSNVFVHVDIGM
jgi:hypothetical protein